MSRGWAPERPIGELDWDGEGDEDDDPPPKKDDMASKEV